MIEQRPRMINASHAEAALSDELRRERYGPSMHDARPPAVQRELEEKARAARLRADAAREKADAIRARVEARTKTPPAPAERPRRSGGTTS